MKDRQGFLDFMHLKNNHRKQRREIMFDVNCACTIDMSEPGPFCLCKTSENHHFCQFVDKWADRGSGTTMKAMLCCV